MSYLLLIIYEFSTVFLPVLIAYAFVRLRARNTGLPFTHFAFVFILFLYIFSVLYVTGVGTVYDLTHFFGDVRAAHMNLTPYFGGSMPDGFILNIVMFVPFGILVPLFWSRNRRFFLIVVIGFIFSLVIELSQLLNSRATDIDDIIANTLGALVGVALFLLGRFMFSPSSKKCAAKIRGKRIDFPNKQLPVQQVRYPEKSSAKSTARGGSMGEAILYLSVMFIAHFVFFNERGAVNLLYGLGG